MIEFKIDVDFSSQAVTMTFSNTETKQIFAAVTETLSKLQYLLEESNQLQINYV